MSWGGILENLDALRGSVMEVEMLQVIVNEKLERRGTSDARIYDLEHVDGLNTIAVRLLAEVSIGLGVAYQRAEQLEGAPRAAFAPNKA